MAICYKYTYLMLCVYDVEDRNRLNIKTTLFIFGQYFH